MPADDEQSKTPEAIGDRAARRVIAVDQVQVQEPPLLTAARALRVPDAALAHVLGLDENNPYLWRVNGQIPRKHLPALAAFLEVTWAKSRAEAEQVAAPPDVLAAFAQLGALVRGATAPVHADRDLRRKYQRVLKRMMAALRSEPGRRALAQEIATLVSGLVASGKAH